MRKLFSILTLLLCICSGAWGDTTILDYTIPSEDPGTGEKTGATGKIDIGVSGKYSNVVISDVTYYGIKLDGENDENGKKWVKAIPTSALQVGDVITIKGWATSNSNNGEYGFDLYTTPGGTLSHSVSITGAKNTILDATYTIASGSALIGASNFYICRKNTKSTIFNSITITRPPTVPTLTGTWTPASNEFYQGDDAPSNPTFFVGASDSSTPASSAYNVVYSLKEGSTAGIVTFDANNGITAISNSTVGTATVVATLTTANAENYLTPTTNTFEYTVTVNAKTPAIAFAPTSVSLKASNLNSASSKVSAEGAFLTANTTGTVSFASNVDGLSVSPTDFTTDETGAFSSTDFTVTYAPTGEGTVPSTNVNLVFSDGTNSFNLPVTYQKVVGHSLKEVSETTTWDWEAVKSSLTTVTLSGETTPKSTDTGINLADFDGEVYGQNATFPESFDAQAIEFSSTQYPAHSSGYFQGTQIKIHTTIPGKLTVKFSNTGSSDRPYRYLYVNGVLDEYKSKTSASGGVVTTQDIPVNAGDIIIKGIIKESDRTDSGTGDQDNYLRIFSITFTPTAEPVNPTTEDNKTYLTTTDKMAGWRAFYDADNSYSVDENTKVYVVAADPEETKVSLTSIEGVPAGVPVILHTSSNADSHKMTLTKADVAAYEGTNLLSWETSAVESKYRLGYNSTDGVGFYPYSGTPASGAVILNVSSATHGAKALMFSFGDETALDDVSADDKVNKGTGLMYNLNGQLVDESYEGIVIIDGKKYNK